MCQPFHIKEIRGRFCQVLNLLLTVYSRGVTREEKRRPKLLNVRVPLPFIHNFKQIGKYT